MSSRHEDKSDRAHWNTKRDLFLVSQLLLQADLGKRADSGFKKEAWRAVTNEFNLEFMVVYTANQMKSRFDCLRRDYKDVKYLRENSGFGWDDVLGVPTAPDSVWSCVIKTNKNYKKFRSCPFPQYNDMAKLLEGAMATGDFAANPPGITSPIHEGQYSPSHTESDVRVEDENEQYTGGRKRAAQEDSSSDSDSDSIDIPTKKAKRRPERRDRRSAGSVIGDAMTKLVEVEMTKMSSAREKDPHERVAQAIQLLVRNYGHLQGNALAIVADKLAQGFNATVFTNLDGSRCL
ncbi:hypothetical protein LEN26_015350, partial [Aphanomyces euteiches]